MMTKKLFISGGAMAFTLASVMTAQAAALTASCSGIPATNSIAWTATSTDGVAPVAYLWSNGATSSAQTLTYTPGTYSLGLTATDASSTVATTTCSAIVVATTTPPVATTTPSVATTTVPLFRQANLNIENDGHFKGKGMVIQSVGVGSFTAKVFGMTFTVNTATTTPSLTIGNYVDVSGVISQTSGVVTAKTVREFPSSKIVTPKVKELKERSKEKKIERVEVKAEQKIQKIKEKESEKIKKIEKKDEKKKDKKEGKKND